MGLLFTPTLSWTSAHEQLAKQARKAICSIKQFQKPFGYFTHADMFKLFDSMISPPSLHLVPKSGEQHTVKSQKKFKLSFANISWE